MKRTGFKKKARTFNNKKTWARPDSTKIIAHQSFGKSYSEKQRKDDYQELMILSGWVLFDSKAEAERYTFLRELETAGEIIDLEIQVSMPLQIKAGPPFEHKKFARAYILDFAYIFEGMKIGEDVKGYPSEVYPIKRDLFIALYPDWEFIEVPMKSIFTHPGDLLRGAR